MTNFLALYLREVHRFGKLWMDTLISPLASMLLFLAVFSVIMADREVTGLPYLTFIYTGLLAMNLLTGSFSNPAFALVIARNVGTMVDLQTTPLRSWQVGLAYALAGATRAAVILAIGLLLTAWFIPELGLENPLLLLAVILISGVQFGMLGTLFGSLAKGFETLPFVTSFVMQPMIFLGGVFYPVSQLPGIWATISMWNPLHHNINLVRYAFVGVSDSDPLVSMAVLVGSLVPIFFGMRWALRRGLQD